MIGIVTTLEGEPLPAGDIASRLGGFKDIEALETVAGASSTTDARLIETILGNQNDKHSAYQDFQKFLELGGKIGLQHDPLLYGAYNLNPFLVRVEEVPMLVVEQGQVAVMKAYVGLPTQDTSGIEFKFGSLVRPGHRGIWQEPLRTGKYPINPRCYQAVIVPTFIITLNWADVVSQAHNLDAQLKQIEAKSSEGFHFAIDLQVQIHIPDTQAPYVISMVGSVANLVNEVLQAAVGNHFRNKLQSMPAVSFIATREAVQQGAFEYVKEELAKYRVETRGVYIQAVVLPEQLVEVLTEREIANQQVATYKMQRSAQDQRTETEKAKGTADMQADLAKSQVGVDIQNNRTAARKMEAQGEATFIEQTGAAQGAQVRSVGLARAEAYERQVAALGRERHGAGERRRSALEEQCAVHAEHAGHGRRRRGRHARRSDGALDAPDRRRACAEASAAEGEGIKSSNWTSAVRGGLDAVQLRVLSSAAPSAPRACRPPRAGRRRARR